MTKASDSEKKSSGNKPADNVVTCQMAGYPAHYSWNESAKACQPGYIDINGNFRPYGSAVPNTYDGGLVKYKWLSLLSLVMAVLCGILLLDDRCKG